MVSAIGWTTACNRVEVAPAAPEAAAEAGDGGAAARATEIAPSGPSVLFVTIDTLRADRVGAYGDADAATPTLDALAERGVLFEDAIATVPLTLPSHASMFTGRYPPAHGVRHNTIFRLDEAAETLAERFAAAGYATGGFVAAAVLSSRFGMAQGFDHFDEELPKERAAAAGYFERPASEITDSVVGWLDETPGPFFAWVHYYDAHASYEPPEPFATEYADRPYDGEVAFVDREFGRLLAHLEAQGRLADTLVVVTSDHGEGLGEHGEATHTYLIYDSVLRVPLVIAGPGVPAGVRIAEVVSNAAVAPTLAAAAGLPPFADADTEDLSPRWQGASEPGWAYAESLAGLYDHGWSPIQAIRTAEHQYIRAPRPELFDQAADAGQLTNLLPTTEAAIAQVVDASEARLVAIDATAEASERTEVDAETRAQIEALGYVVPVGQVEGNGADPKDVHTLAAGMFDAMALYQARRYADAERLSLAMLERLPHSHQLHDILARTYIETGRPDKALPYAREVARLVPDWTEGHGLVGQAALALGDLPTAVGAFTRANELNPEDPGAHLGMMWDAKLGGDVASAAAHAERALALGGDRVAIWDTLGEIWEGLGEYERALSVYENALERFPDAAKLEMRLAIQYARLGDEARSADHFARAGKYAESLQLRNRHAIVYAARGDVDRAETMLRGIVAQHPQSARTRRNLGPSAPADRPAGGSPARARRQPRACDTARGARRLGPARGPGRGAALPSRS